MKVYHTSYSIVEKPDTRHSRKEIDFGPGFYVTPILAQAKRYIPRIKSVNKNPIVNVYEYNGNTSDLTHRRFEEYGREWLEFIVACRKGISQEHFDIIEGGVADDRVFETVTLYSLNYLPINEALRRLKYFKPTWQICFTTQKAIDQCLTFQWKEPLVDPRETLFHMKYSQIIGLVAKKLGVSQEKAMDLFYGSETFKALRDPGCDLYVMSDEYLAEDVCREQEDYIPEP